MAGGRAHYGKYDDMYQELIYRFEFPESPGALKIFLDKLNEYNNWNISLFHYRSHGHDFGRVLIGLLVKPIEYDQFNCFLEDLGYVYYNETDNRVYKTFFK